MTEIVEYICDYCGEKFQNEVECLDHEQEHIIEAIKNDLFFWDIDMKPLKVCAGNLEDTWYIHWRSHYAFNVLVNWYNERIDNCYSFSPWKNDSEGFVCYNDSAYNDWESFADMKEKINKIDKMFRGK